MTEILTDSSANFGSLFVNIQYVTACLFEKLLTKIRTTVAEIQKLF